MNKHVAWNNSLFNDCHRSKPTNLEQLGKNFAFDKKKKCVNFINCQTSIKFIFFLFPGENVKEAKKMKQCLLQLPKLNVENIIRPREKTKCAKLLIT